jgi:hypothetical protein
MTLQEKILYHQIHPLKLGTDVSTSVLASLLLWQHRLAPAMLIAFLPALAMTALFIRFADLERQKASGFGRYLRLNMSRAVEAQRFAGQALAWLGVWHHQPTVIALGAAVIVLAWLSGLGRPALA